MGRWYKCDLQLASPLGGFALPGADLTSPAGRAKAAAEYVELVKASGIEIFAVTDHNSTEMLEELGTASRTAGLVMFPGMELSTGTGSDGVHLLLIGDPDADIAKLTSSWLHAAGFTPDHPPFFQGKHVPSPRSLIEILDHLPEDTIAIGPHVLNENGMASKESIQEQSLRWRCLHHDRLEAIEVGVPSDSTGWNQQFRERKLDDFPLLQRMAFVSTSDAYEPGKLGPYTWIRMREPSLDALRQALLDYKARMICDWEPRGSTDPNVVTHGHIKDISMDGLSTSNEPLELDFDPRVNVIIGSRGTGKSTIIEGLRALYGGGRSLPASIEAESSRYQSNVFADATLKSTYVEALSGASDLATWTHGRGAQSERGQSLLPVRVVTQKELFERTSGSAVRSQSASSNMLALVDEALDDDEVAAELLAEGHDVSSARAAVIEVDQSERRSTYVQAVIRRLELERRAAERGIVEGRIEELARKIAALEDPDEREKLAAADTTISTAATVDRYDADVKAWIGELRSQVPPTATAPQGEFATSELNDLAELVANLKSTIDSAISTAETAQQRRAAARSDPTGDFATALRAAREVLEAYRQKLAALGIEVSQYDSLKTELETSRSQLAAIDVAEQQLPGARDAEANAWSAVDELSVRRSEARRRFLGLVGSRVPSLRFKVLTGGDPTAWKSDVHRDLGLRVNDHQESLDALARWLWVDADDETRSARFQEWQHALLANDYGRLCSGLTESFLRRLKNAAEAVRVNLSSLRADDALETSFLKEGADPVLDASWQTVTDGSPGQRSAAMLAFILSYGNQPLVLDQPEDDLDSKLVSDLVVENFRHARWRRQLIVVTREANIPVNVDAELVVVLENVAGCLRIKTGDSGPHLGPIDAPDVRRDIQDLLEGGVRAFINRERRYDNELSRYRQDLLATSTKSRPDAGQSA